MTIRIDDLTKEVALIVTDFFEGEDEEEELRLYGTIIFTN